MKRLASIILLIAITFTHVACGDTSTTSKVQENAVDLTMENCEQYLDVDAYVE